MKELFRFPISNDDDKDEYFTKIAWNPNSQYMALSKISSNEIQIIDREGSLTTSINLFQKKEVLSLEWNISGSILAILQEGNNEICIWDMRLQKLFTLMLELNDFPIALAWHIVQDDDKSNHKLAIGTLKGNLLLYHYSEKSDSNHDEMISFTQNIPIKILGKHTGKIQCGQWNPSSNHLILGSSDCTCTISNMEGDTLAHLNLNNEPLEICSPPKDVIEDNSNTIVAVILCEDKLLLLIEDIDPVEISFEDENDKIVSFDFISNDSIIVGLESGFLKLLSISIDGTYNIMWTKKAYEGILEEMVYSRSLKKCAIIGDQDLKILSVNESDCLIINEQSMICNKHTDQIIWSPDGNILSILSGGLVSTYLIHIPRKYATYGTKIAILSSLREISCIDVSNSKSSNDNIYIVNQEPTNIALGPNHICCVDGTDIKLYKLATDKRQIEMYHSYPEKIVICSLNNKFLAIVSELNTFVLEEIKEIGGNEIAIKTIYHSKTSGENLDDISCMSITEDFLIIATKTGKIIFFNFRELSFSLELEFQHSCSIELMSLNRVGTRIAFVDSEGNGYLYNPVCYDLISFPNFPNTVDTIIWDQCDKNIIFVFDGVNLHSYVYAPLTIRGAMLMKFGSVEIDKNGGISVDPHVIPLPVADYVPILSYERELQCHSVSMGGLKPFKTLTADRESDNTYLDNTLHFFNQNLALHRLNHAWAAALVLNKKKYWLALGNKALQLMDIHMGSQVYRQLGDAGMVVTLNKLLNIEDKNLLSGHISLLYMDFDIAQELFLSSSRPVTALEMRRDLHQWEEALKLARDICPGQIPLISMEFAKDNEIEGNNQEALRLYEEAKSGLLDSEVKRKERDSISKVINGGIARTSLKLGSFNIGICLAKESNDNSLQLECANILMSQHQLSDAAHLFKMTGAFEKAVLIFIEINDFHNASSIIDKISSLDTLMKYGAFCEQQKKENSAVEAYKRAQAMDDVVRLYLGPLDKIEEAISIVRSSKSSSGAAIIAKYFTDHCDYATALEFQLLSGQKLSAFEYAKKHDCMETYLKYINADIKTDDAEKLAHYYESRNNIGEAGKYNALAGKFERAFQLYLQAGEKYLSNAIHIIGLANDETLTHQMIDFLMGETDGMPKDPNYVYQLYIALGNHADAAKTAIIIAEQEQNDGNYDKSHEIISSAIIELDNKNVPVPKKLREMFVLFHTYRLAKKIARRGDHESTARLLLRIVKHAQQFPNHHFFIIVSTIIECQKSGLKNSAHKLATYLCSNKDCRKELQSSKFKKKIQAIVRRPSKEEKADTLTKCPISNQMIPSMDLECPSTKDAIPICICSGTHMVLDDWCFCPISKLPAIYSEYVAYIKSEVANEDSLDESSSSENLSALDPISGVKVRICDLKKSSSKEAQDYIKKYNTYVKAAHE